MKVAILGSGNIGTDLLIKILASPYLECGVFIGRSALSNGIKVARALGVTTSTSSIQYIENYPNCCDIVFDATSAEAHTRHAPILRRLKKFTIDLTPAKQGVLCIPVINSTNVLQSENINMVTCGGQAALPIAHALTQACTEIEYLEVVSSIASSSAGPATRINLDEYIHTTERAMRLFSGAKKVKAILNLNPAIPCINMQVTVFAKAKSLNMELFSHLVNLIEKQVQHYVPGYKIIVKPMIEQGRIIVVVRVLGQGDYLPEYAGNLDIINCAAIAIAEKYAMLRQSVTIL